MIRRFYVPDLSEGKVIIDGLEAHHAINVLRVKNGDNIELFDGDGRYAQGNIVGISKSKIEVIADKIETSTRPKVNITLALAIPKYSRQETLILMCTELGISKFLPVVFSRSSVRENFRIEKWVRWSIQACKQSRRNYLPVITEPMGFDNFINSIHEYDCVIYGEHQASNKNRIELTNKENILIIVGPEGGFTSDEIETMQSQGASAMRIGQHILRIETSAVALSTAVIWSIGSDS